MKWEYKVVEINKDCLEHLGNEGWELICTRWDEGNPMLGFFKRPKDWEYMNKINYRGLGEIPF
ncbi:MAG TPA: hypothetical protein VEP90_24290 [Methylomirabilota bacterium]|nr:hypothetical protein [Methylomirabilota bacterium]